MYINIQDIHRGVHNQILVLLKKTNTLSTTTGNYPKTTKRSQNRCKNHYL